MRVLHKQLIDMEIKDRIRRQALKLFFRKGIRSVTMNEVSEALGISKRTLYEHFSNKEDLLVQCINLDYQEYLEERKKLEKGARNILEVVHRQFRLTLARLRDIHPSFGDELKKFHPNIWHNQILELQKERDGYSRQVISEGIKQGYFREDTDPEIASKLLFAHVHLMSDVEMFPPERFPRAELFRHIITGFLRSLATDKGLKEMEDLFYNKPHDVYVSY